MSIESAGQTDERVGLPRGVRLGVDVGSVRVGVARSDPDGLIATPEATVAHVPGRHVDVVAVARLVAETFAPAVYIGLPRTLAGRESESARRAREFASALVESIRSVAAHDVEVRLVDERLTTVDAARQLRDSGRRAKAQRQVIDQAAAVLILQVALDHERATGRRAGVPLGVGPGEQVGEPPETPGLSAGSTTPEVPRRKPRHKRRTTTEGRETGPT